MPKRVPLALFLCPVLAGPAAAQTPLGGEFRVNEQTTDIQRRPSVAADGADNFVVVWESFVGDGGGAAVLGRRFDAAGNPQGGDFVVNAYTTNAQFGPSVTYARDGSFVVVWTSYRQDGSTQGVFGRRFDGQGNPATPEFQVNTYTTNYQAKGRVAALLRGDFVVVWESAAGDGDIFGVFGQRFDQAGNKLGGEFQVNTYTTGYQERPDVSADAAGNFVVVWESGGQIGSSYQIFGQRYDAAGNRLGEEFRVSSSGGFGPRVVADADGSFTVGFTAFDGDRGGVFLRRYDRQGVPLGLETMFNSDFRANQLLDSLALDANANLLGGWTASDEDGSEFGISARERDCAGQDLAPDFVVNTYTAGYQAHAAVAAAGSNFVVAWESRGQDGSLDGIFAQRLHGANACGRFHAITPCRLADTRNPTGPSGGPALGANTTRSLPVGGLCGIPLQARAVALNVTAVGQTDLGDLRVFPSGYPAPPASALNFVAGHTRANNAVVRLGAAGQISVRCDMPAGSTGATHVVLDAYGYFR
jgi:hypothetical protein